MFLCRLLCINDSILSIAFGNYNIWFDGLAGYNLLLIRNHAEHNVHLRQIAFTD